MYCPKGNCIKCLKYTDAYFGDISNFCCWECKQVNLDKCKHVTIKQNPIFNKVTWEEWTKDLNERLIYLAVQK